MKVCVVGAGPCGLTTIKQLRDEGHDVVCFDKNADLGGLWLRHEDPQTDADEMKAYDNLMLTISMKLMAYSDHPFGDGRVFYTRAQYLEYLHGYADRFGLAERVSFGAEVTDIRREGRRWTVTIVREGVTSSETFDAVAVCSGPFKTPNRQIPGLESFTGEVVHSSEYRNSDRFAGKRVLIVGMAESGADLVREIGDAATECTLAIRSYTYLLPRVFNRTRTTDNGTVRAHAHEMCRRSSEYPFVLDTVWGRNYLVKAVFLTVSVVLGILTTATGVVRAFAGRAPGGRRTVVPDVNPLGQPMEPAKIDIDTLDNAANWDMIRTWNRRSHPDGSWAQRAIFCKNVSFVPSLVDGRVSLNDSGIIGSDGSTVRFRDGSSGQFDAVVLCTGFTTEKLSIGDLQVKDGNVRNLYKHFVHPEHDGTAVFIGFVRPFSGGIPICAEMQARYFARLCSGKLTLPSNIDERIGREKEWEEHWTALSPGHTEAIPSQVLYLDALAREIGCLVPAWRMMLNPRLFIQLWFGSFNQSCYRIVGPHKLGRAALDDLYSETVENRWQMAGQLALLQLAPRRVHPKHLI